MNIFARGKDINGEKKFFALVSISNGSKQSDICALVSQKKKKIIKIYNSIYSNSFLVSNIKLFYYYYGEFTNAPSSGFEPAILPSTLSYKQYKKHCRIIKNIAFSAQYQCT